LNREFSFALVLARIYGEPKSGMGNYCYSKKGKKNREW
jgi:hypothetical protein